MRKHKRNIKLMKMQGIMSEDENKESKKLKKKTRREKNKKE